MNHETPPMDDSDPPELHGLGWAVDVLRETPTVTPEWRRQLLASLQDDALTATTDGPRLAVRAGSRQPIEDERRVAGRHLVVHPVLALAAGMACVLLGAAGQRWVMSSRAAPNDIASAGTDAPADVAVRSDAGGVALQQAGVTTDRLGDRIAVRFAIMAPGAQRVSLVGDFNRWDPSVTPLTLSRDGSTWTTMLPMQAGRHTYAFVIDGDVVPDPTAPMAADDDFGIPNSVILVMRSP